MNKIFSVWIASLPLIVLNNHFEVPKVLYFLVGGIFLMVNLILNFKKVVIKDYDKFYFLWLAILLVSSLFSDDIKTSILGGSYRHQGLIFFVCLWLVMKYFEIQSLKDRVFTYKLFGITVLIESVLVLVGYKLGTIGDINAVSGFLAMGGSFIFLYLPKWLIIFPFSSMLINFSKSAFLSLIQFLFKRLNMFLIVLLVVILFILKPISNLSPFENRSVIWNHAVNLIVQKPIVGYGLESNEKMFDKAFYNSGFPLSNLIIDRSHNLILDVTLWSGIFGLLSFSLFVYLKFKSLNNEMRKIFISFLIYAMFQPISVVHWIILVLLV